MGDSAEREAGRELFIKSAADLATGIRHCLDHQLPLPALLLIYAGIDIMGSLGRPIGTKAGKNIGKTFKSWAATYLEPEQKLGCSAADLWAARNGLLHTYGPHSQLVRNRQAKRIIYAWGSADIDPLNEVIRERPDDIPTVAVHVQTLFWAFVEGMHAFVAALGEDPELGPAAYARAQESFFVNVSADPADHNP